MRHDDTAREALTQARYRLRSARYHFTFPPCVPARVIGGLVLARGALKDAEDSVTVLMGRLLCGWCRRRGRRPASPVRRRRWTFRTST